MWFSFPERHPVLWTVVCFVVWGFPQWLSSIWSLVSDKPLADVIRPRLNAMNIPNVSPYWITGTAGSVMFLWLVYEMRRNARQTKNRDPNEKNDGAAKSLSPIQINFGSGQFFENKINRVHYIITILSVEIKNSGDTPITNCNVFFERIMQDGSKKSYRIDHGFSLGPDQRKYIECLRHQEATGSNPPIKDPIRILFPHDGTFGSNDELLPGDVVNYATIRVDCLEQKSNEEMFKIFVDNDKLIVEKT